MTTKELSEQEINRYSENDSGEWFPSPLHGYWCTYQDHESIVNALRAEIERLKKQLEPAQIDERSAFEKEYSKHHECSVKMNSPHMFQFDGSRYTTGNVNDYWEIWQARAQLERGGV